MLKIREYEDGIYKLEIEYRHACTTFKMNKVLKEIEVPTELKEKQKGTDLTIKFDGE